MGFYARSRVGDYIYSETLKTKYSKKILSDREYSETLVMSSILKDLSLLDDYAFSKDDFLSEEYAILFRIANNLHNDGYQLATPVEIKSALKEEERKLFKEMDILKLIEDYGAISNKDNFSDYVDKLYKNNIYMKLTDIGIDLFKPVYMNKKSIVPFDFFKDLSSVDVKEFYESYVNDFSTVDLDKGIEEVEIDFDDEYFESICKGETSGTLFNIGGVDITNNPITAFPTISQQSNGIIDNSMTVLAGYSNVGKSTFIVSMVMAMVYRGEKVCICSNEQKSKPFLDNFLMWILVNKMGYKGLDKNKLRAGLDAFTEEDIKMLHEARDIWRKEYKGSIVFISLPNARMESVQKKFREYYLKYGCTFFVYDTFKIDFSSARENFWLSLIEDSRKLAEFANRYNTKVFATMQCALHTQGQLFLDANVLSNSKQVKEILQNLYIIRDMYDEEKDETSKFYCNPYTVRWKRNELGVLTKEEDVYILDPQKNYKVIFLDKLREGKTSQLGNYAVVVEFVGEYGTMKEVCLCRPKRANINAGQKRSSSK